MAVPSGVSRADGDLGNRGSERRAIARLYFGEKNFKGSCNEPRIQEIHWNRKLGFASEIRIQEIHWNRKLGFASEI